MVAFGVEEVPDAEAAFDVAAEVVPFVVEALPDVVVAVVAGAVEVALDVGVAAEAVPFAVVALSDVVVDVAAVVPDAVDRHY